MALGNNYATKYSAVIDERFNLGAKTAEAVNNDYDWLDANVVKVYQIGTKQMADYSATSGMTRFGTATEIESEPETLTLSKDRAFTFTIDRKTAEDNPNGAFDAGKALSRQIDEVILPEIDKYRIGMMIKDGTVTTDTDAISASNCFSYILDAATAMDAAGVPVAGRVLFVSPNTYKFLLKDANFIKASDIAQNMLIKGALGECLGMPVVLVPATYMKSATTTDTATYDFVIVHKSAVVSPIKLAMYRVLEEVPGLDGKLVEGRVRYDAFVLSQKKVGVQAHKQG